MSPHVYIHGLHVPCLEVNTQIGEGPVWVVAGAFCPVLTDAEILASVPGKDRVSGDVTSLLDDTLISPASVLFKIKFRKVLRAA